MISLSIWENLQQIKEQKKLANTAKWRKNWENYTIDNFWKIPCKSSLIKFFKQQWFPYDCKDVTAEELLNINKYIKIQHDLRTLVLSKQLNSLAFNGNQ